MLAPTSKETGQQRHRADHSDYGNGIALDGAGALNRLAAGNAGKPGALPGRIVAPIGNGIAEITGNITGIMRQRAADVPCLAAQFTDLGGKGLKGVMLTAAGCEQIFKTHGILPGYGRNAIGRTQVPYTINDFDLTVRGRELGSRMVST